MINRQDTFAHTAPIFKKLKILRRRDIGKQQMMLLMHRKRISSQPVALDSLFTVLEPLRVTRLTHHFYELFTNKLYRTHTVRCAAPRLWNYIRGPRFPIIQSVPATKNRSQKYFKDLLFRLLLALDNWLTRWCMYFIISVQVPCMTFLLIVYYHLYIIMHIRAIW